MQGVPQEGCDQLHQLVAGNDLLVEQHEAAKEVVVHVLVVKKLANLEEGGGGGV